MKQVFALAFLILSLILASMAYADDVKFVVTMKNGNTMTWYSHWVDGDNHCTNKAGGMFCIPKNEVASVKEVTDEAYDTAKVIDTTAPIKSTVVPTGEYADTAGAHQSWVRKSLEITKRWHDYSNSIRKN